MPETDAKEVMTKPMSQAARIFSLPETKPYIDIRSDTFGFMAHQNPNTITIEKGTVVDSGYATFLVKTGASSQVLTANIDGAEISNGGVLIQERCECHPYHASGWCGLGSD